MPTSPPSCCHQVGDIEGLLLSERALSFAALVAQRAQLVMLEEEQAEQRKQKVAAAAVAAVAVAGASAGGKAVPPQQAEGPAPEAAAEGGDDDGMAFTAHGLSLLLIGAVRCGLFKKTLGAANPMVQRQGDSSSPSEAARAPLLDSQGWMSVWSDRALTLSARSGSGSEGGFGPDAVSGILAAVTEASMQLPPDLIYALVGGFLDKVSVTVAAREALRLRRERARQQAVAAAAARPVTGRRERAAVGAEGEEEEEEERDGLSPEQWADVLGALAAQRWPLPAVWLPSMQQVWGRGGEEDMMFGKGPLMVRWRLSAGRSLRSGRPQCSRCGGVRGERRMCGKGLSGGGIIILAVAFVYSRRSRVHL